MQRHATVKESVQMKLSKAQSASIKAIDYGIKAGFVVSIPVVFGIAASADTQLVADTIIRILATPFVSAIIGSSVGCTALVVSTIIRVLWSAK